MKIRANILKLNEINQNRNYVSTEVALQSIESLKQTKTRVWDDALCALYVTNGDSYGSCRDLTRLIGKVTTLGIDETGSYLYLEAEIIPTTNGQAVMDLLRQGLQLKIAVNVVFKDRYSYEIESKTETVDCEKENEFESASEPEYYTIIDKMDIRDMVVCTPTSDLPDTSDFYIKIVED